VLEEALHSDAFELMLTLDVQRTVLVCTCVLPVSILDLDGVLVRDVGVVVPALLDSESSCKPDDVHPAFRRAG